MSKSNTRLDKCSTLVKFTDIFYAGGHDEPPASDTLIDDYILYVKHQLGVDIADKLSVKPHSQPEFNIKSKLWSVSFSLKGDWHTLIDLRLLSLGYAKSNLNNCFVLDRPINVDKLAASISFPMGSVLKAFDRSMNDTLPTPISKAEYWYNFINNGKRFIRVIQLCEVS